MSSIVCAITGEVPEEPVVSTKSGHVFEKKLIEKQIEATGRCPVTEDELSMADLIPLNQRNPAIKPRAPSGSSLSSLLKTFQNEWDAVMLEMYTLKQHLNTTRQELAHTLYQHDAACRVIARLTKERDDARRALADTRANMARAVSGDAMDVEQEAGAGITPDIIQTMADKAKTLSKARKKKFKAAPSESVASKEDITGFEVLTSNPLHGTSKPGITCMDLTEERTLTGGVDGNVIIRNRETRKMIQNVKDHTKSISAVCFHPSDDVFLSASMDSTAMVFGKGDDDKYTAKATFSHSAAVTDLSLHPTGQYFVTCAEDDSWSFHDLASGSTRQRVTHDDAQGGYSGISFHPDGLLVCTTGKDNHVRVWDVKTQKNVASFAEHQGGVTSLNFSENGYWLATGDATGVVKLWDLRKLKNFHTIASEDESTAINRLQFDYSGQYLAVASANLRVLAAKSWDVVKSFDAHKKQVTDVRFAADAQSLFSVSMDRTIKCYGAK